MNKYEPLISVIIAVYNGELYLENAINSVLDQEYKSWELIIINGGSKDGTQKIINRYKDHIKYTINEQDKGIYDAWNKGLIKASGSWIVFIGSDDILYPHAFKKYIEFIGGNKDHNNLEFVSSKIEIINNDMKVLDIVGQPWNWSLFKKKMITWHVGTFHSNKLFIKYGFFDDSFKISGDYEFLLRAKNTLKTAYLPIVTVKMRDGGVSASLLFQAMEETYRAKVKNGIISPLLGFFLKLNNKIKLTTKIFLVKKGVIKKL